MSTQNDPFAPDAEATSPTGGSRIGAATGQISTVLSGLASRVRPLTSSASKGFVQTYARERLGGQDVTDLPAKYKELEEKVDKIKAIHESLIRVSANYTKPHYDYEPLLSESALNFAESVRGRVTSLAGQPTSPKDEIPKSLSHAFSRAASQGSSILPPEEPLTTALTKFGKAHDRIGNARLNLASLHIDGVQDSDATQKFHKPMLATLNEQIAQAMKARQKVRAARLTYDAARARLKAAKPEREEAARTEMETTEDEFVAVVDDAMGKMTLVVENGSGTALKSVADLVNAQLIYFKTTYEILAELSPELNELAVGTLLRKHELAASLLRSSLTILMGPSFAMDLLERAQELVKSILDSSSKTQIAIAVAVAVFGTSTALAVTKSRKVKGSPPVVPGYPFVGNPAFFRRRYEFLKEWTGRLGHFFEFKLAGYRVFHLSGVPLRQFFLSTDTSSLSMSDGYTVLHGTIPDMNKIVQQQEDATDKMKMSLFQRRLGMMLKAERLNESLPVLINDMRESMLRWGPQGEMDPFHNFFKLVFKLTVRMLGPREIAESDANLNKLESLYLTVEYASGVVNNYFKWIPSKCRENREKANQGLFFMLSEIIDKRIEERSSGVFREKKDSVDVLLDCGDHKYDIISFIIGSLFAGYLNTGMASAWLVVFLIQKPEWKARILSELEAACVRHAATLNKPAYLPNGIPDLTVLPFSAFDSELPSLNACVAETVRHITSGGTMLRRVMKDGIVVEGFKIPRGSFLSYQIGDTNMNENLYASPDEFDPAHFENKKDDPVLGSKEMYEFLGWGAGRHPCLGMGFAKIELKIIVCLALTQYNFQLQSKSKPTINRNDFIRAVPKEPVTLKFMARS
ncbi:hypothetical protein HDU97_001391 [Phlyctochytrium planicorne]|nr:hypothetical protein HDU97_001391 [Phlyctochytrium planicorne]